MRRVLTKILHEMESTQTSDTWVRLRRYQGVFAGTAIGTAVKPMSALSSREQAETSGDESSRSSGADNSVGSTNQRPSELAVEPPSMRETTRQGDPDEDSDDQAVHAEIQLAVVHPDEIRQAQRNINKVSGSGVASEVSGGGSGGRGPNSVAATAATQAQRKHATTTL